jgi:hypothetical protein
MVRVLKIDKNENLLETIDILYKELWNHSHLLLKDKHLQFVA